MTNVLEIDKTKSYLFYVDDKMRLDDIDKTNKKLDGFFKSNDKFIVINGLELRSVENKPSLKQRIRFLFTGKIYG